MFRHNRFFLLVAPFFVFPFSLSLAITRTTEMSEVQTQITELREIYTEPVLPSDDGCGCSEVDTDSRDIDFVSFHTAKAQLTCEDELEKKKAAAIAQYRARIDLLEQHVLATFNKEYPLLIWMLKDKTDKAHAQQLFEQLIQAVNTEISTLQEAIEAVSAARTCEELKNAQDWIKNAWSAAAANIKKLNSELSNFLERVLLPRK